MFLVSELLFIKFVSDIDAIAKNVQFADVLFACQYIRHGALATHVK